MHAVLDLKSSPWQPAERLDALKNGMKFRIAKKNMSDVCLKSMLARPLHSDNPLKL